MSTVEATGDRIRHARKAAHLGQRALESATGLSQATLSRIETGSRRPKVNELLAISWAVGSTISELTGHSVVRDRVECVARASDDVTMDGLQEEVTHYLELDAYLDEQGVPQPA